ncbi:FAD binding domain-containing protein [Crassisporium funariophilum]|nr:FAD binding domain-containing protein [Crassisporium funariophilum]
MSVLATTNFAQSVKGDVVTSDHPDHPKAIARWAANAERKAKVIVFVKNNLDVVSCLQFARANHLAIAVRGGGHSAGGASSIEDGLVIDLSRYMNGVTVDPSKKLAYVGGGALWEAVDKAGIAHGLATVAGTVNHTGVGGLTLGGGYGWLSGAYGLVIDNLAQVTLVTADGSILTVNETENSDLFFAVRGGGGNFGVVTEFVLRLHPQRSTVYCGILMFHVSALEKLIEATQHWLESAGENEGLLQMTTVGPDGNPAIAVFPFFNGTEIEGRDRFKAILDIGPVADMSKEMPFEQLNSLQNPMAGHGRGVYMKGFAHKKPHYPSIASAHQKFVAIAKSHSFQGGLLYEYFPLAKVNSVATNATAFRREVAPNVVVLLNWDPKIQDLSEEARKNAYELAAIVSEGQSEITSSESLGYSNYDPEGVEELGDGVLDRAKLVFGENYPRLQAIKKRYDPGNMFNKWFPIVPA